MVFHWSLRDSNCPQVSKTLLSILAVLNNAIVWMVSTRPLTSKSSSPFSNPLVTVPKSPITIGIIITFMFNSFFQFSGKVEVFILLFIIFHFYSIASRDIRVHYYYYYFYYHYFTRWEFFTPTLADGFPMKLEWQQVTSSLLDSS